MKNNRIRLWVNPIAVGVATMVFVGCAPTPIFHKYQIANDEATSILIDAKQRAILAVAPPDHAQQGGSRKEVSPELARRILVCAEPSPDALSVASTSLNVSGGISVLNGDKEKVKIENILKEIAQELGSRDTTIQLLRDGLYRQCEAYLNGVIDPEEYKTLTHRYVDAMITLLAIERITPGPTNVTEPHSKQKRMDEKQSSPDEKPISKEAIDGVKEITRAFLNKNLVDKCISHKNKEKNKEGFIEACTAVSILLMSEKDKALLSNVTKLPEILDVLKKNKALTEKANVTMGTTNSRLEQTNEAIGKTNAELTKTNTALGTTKEELTKANTGLGTTNKALNNTNDKLKQTNEALSATKDELTKTNTVLGETNKALNNTNKRLNQINNDVLDKPKMSGETKSDGERTSKGVEATDEPKASLDETETSIGKSETSK